MLIGLLMMTGLPPPVVGLQFGPDVGVPYFEEPPADARSNGITARSEARAAAVNVKTGFIVIASSSRALSHAAPRMCSREGLNRREERMFRKRAMIGHVWSLPVDPIRNSCSG